MPEPARIRMAARYERRLIGDGKYEHIGYDRDGTVLWRVVALLIDDTENHDPGDEDRG